MSTDDLFRICNYAVMPAWFLLFVLPHHRITQLLVTLSMRDKRILLLGMIAAQGEGMTFRIQTRAGIKNGELTPEEIRELHLFIAQYCGYPKAASLLGPMEEGIAEAQKDKETEA